MIFKNNKIGPLRRSPKLRKSSRLHFHESGQSNILAGYSEPECTKQ